MICLLVSIVVVIKRQRERTKNKIIKVTIMSAFVSKIYTDLPKIKKKGTYGLGYKLTSTGITDNAVLNKDNTVNNAEIKINSIDWFVPHYTPSFSQQAELFKQIQDKTPTELQYPGRSIFMKEVNPQSFWNFELGTRESVDIPVRVFVIFKQSDGEHDLKLNNVTFCKLPVTSA